VSYKTQEILNVIQFNDILILQTVKFFNIEASFFTDGFQIDLYMKCRLYLKFCNEILH